jgi:hypothetical protein
MAARKKSKWIAGLLAFVPGTGHFYLGMMLRGLFFMLLLIFDIAAINYLSLNPEFFNVPLIVLLSLFIPVIVLYNIFDAVLSAEKLNRKLEDGRSLPPPAVDALHVPAEDRANAERPENTSRTGWFVLIVGLLFFFLGGKSLGLDRALSFQGSFWGGLAFIATGVFLYFRQAKKRAHEVIGYLE